VKTKAFTICPSPRVRVEAEVAPDEVERRRQQTAIPRAEMKNPGFGHGKVPAARVVPLRASAARRSSTRPCALATSDLVRPIGYRPAGPASAPVGDPELALRRTFRARGEALTFSIEIGGAPQPS